MIDTRPAEKRVHTSQGEICFFEWGEAGAGPSILLLHATGFHARCWDKLVAALPDQYHLIAVDQLGHGRSAKPARLTSWEMIATANAELVETLAINFAVGVGHSMGGHCLVQQAARAAGSIKNLLLVDPVIMDREVYQDPPDYSASNQMVSKRRNIWIDADEMFERFKDRHPYSLWDPEVLRDYCEYGLLAGPDGKYQLACPPTVEGAVYATSASVDPWPLLSKIHQPVIILRAPQFVQEGQFDFASSPTPPTLASGFANGEDIFVDDLTHFMPMQDPVRIAGYITYALDGLDAARS